MDYDVEAVTLAVPPSPGYRSAYRPAISVRNNGRFDSLATGTLRIYKAGLLIYNSAVLSGTIHPGALGLATATDDWTPETIGEYVFSGYVTCYRDQFEPNNNLRSTTVQIIEGQPPDPPVVTAHASQHENGGTDELILDGLHGTLEDPQTPTLHSARHQVGGDDLLNVTGLFGVLAEGQPIAEHHEEHEDGGTDELNVDELHGVLYNLQKPQVHGNEAHDPNFAGSPHGNAAHDPNFCSLDENGLVDPSDLGGSPTRSTLFLRADQTWRSPSSASTLYSRTQIKAHPLASYEALHAIIPAGMTQGATFRLYLWGLAISAAPKSLECTVYARNITDPAYVQISRSAIASDTAAGQTWYELDAVLSLTHVGAPLRLYPSGFLSLLHDTLLANTPSLIVAPVAELDEFTPDADLDTEVSVVLTAPDDDGTLISGFVRALSFGDLT